MTLSPATGPTPTPPANASSSRDVLRLFGHPLHAAAVHVPLGLLVAAPFFDAAALALDSPTAWTIGFYTTLVGVGSALLVAVVGLADLLRAVAGPARRTALAHMGTNVGAVVMFTLGLVVRGGPSVAAGRGGLVLVADLAGLGLLAVAGWLGAELVFRHGVGAVRDVPQARTEGVEGTAERDVRDDAA